MENKWTGDPTAFSKWARAPETADRFYEWLGEASGAAAQAADPCLVMTERRKGDKELLALTTPKHIADMANFVDYWLPRNVYERLKKEKEDARPACRAPEK